MSVYQKPEVYRIVAADGGGVRVLMPGGFGSTELEEFFPNASAAVDAIAHAIEEGMPDLDVLDETVSARTTRA